jgi:hypothetical protein
MEARVRPCITESMARFSVACAVVRVAQPRLRPTMELAHRPATQHQSSSRASRDAVYAQSLGNRIVWFLLRRLCHHGRYHSGGFCSASQVINIVPHPVDVYVTGTVVVPRTSNRRFVRRSLELGRKQPADRLPQITESRFLKLEMANGRPCDVRSFPSWFSAQQCFVNHPPLECRIKVSQRVTDGRGCGVPT